MEWLKALRGSGDHLTSREIVAELDKYIVGQVSVARPTLIPPALFSLIYRKSKTGLFAAAILKTLQHNIGFGNQAHQAVMVHHR